MIFYTHMFVQINFSYYFEVNWNGKGNLLAIYKIIEKIDPYKHVGTLPELYTWLAVKFWKILTSAIRIDLSLSLGQIRKILFSDNFRNFAKACQLSWQREKILEFLKAPELPYAGHQNTLFSFYKHNFIRTLSLKFVQIRKDKSAAVQTMKSVHDDRTCSEMHFKHIHTFFYKKLSERDRAKSFLKF